MKHTTAPQPIHHPAYQHSVVHELKRLMRMDDYFGDRWGVAMGWFFDVAAHTYELGETPPEWEYRIGLAGNILNCDNPWFDYLQGLDFDQLLEVGNYLHRLTNALKSTDHAY